MRVESKIGTILKTQEAIYNFISKLNNFENLIPKDKVQNWQATEDNCSFSVPGAGDLEVEIINREPTKTIKFSGKSKGQPINFFLWIQLKEVNENDTKVKITIDAELPIMLRTMAKKPLQEALNTIIDALPRLADFL